MPSFPRAGSPASAIVGAILVAALGFALVLIGLFVAHGTAGVLLSMLIGALLVFIGVSLFASQLVRPLASVLGWPAARLGGVAGGLARDNAQRNPQRTASTASALMIGLALVTLVAVLAAGIIKPFQDAVDQLFTADYAITAQNNFDPIPPSAASAAAKTPGVETIASVRGGDGLVVLTPGKGSDDPGDRRRAGDQQGDLARLAGRQSVDDRQPRRDRSRREQGVREGSQPDASARRSR